MGVMCSVMVAVVGCRSGSEPVAEGSAMAAEDRDEGLEGALDLLSAQLEVADGNATITWTLAGSPPVELPKDARYVWEANITDLEAERVSLITVILDDTGRMSARVYVRGPSYSDSPKLPPPRVEGNTIRLVASLEDLGWSGERAEWSASVSRNDGRPDGPGMEEVDTTGRFEYP